MRDHEPIQLKELNGYYNRGDVEKVPSNHLADCQNLMPYGDGGVIVRPGVDMFQNVAVPLGNIVRMYNFVTQDKNTLLVLTWDGVDGKIYHVIDSTTVQGPILTKAGMQDFAFVPWAGRAYISPFKTFTTGGINIEKGLQSEFVYVYLGDGTAARKAAGTAPAGTITVANGAAGNVDAGFHLYGVVGETNTGFLSTPFAFAGHTNVLNTSVSFTTVPTFVGAQWVKRHIVATIEIENYNGNTTGYEYFFIPDATINDNVGTTLSNISFFDADLVDNASHLLDNYTEIPAGANLGIYHNRLIVIATYTDISLALVSAIGEPEAIHQVDGLLVVPPDGNPLTNAVEHRDILYITKRNRTVSYVDNDDEPSTWPMTVIDQAIGAPVHGIATVIDSGATSVDYLLMASFKGLILFNGRYIVPELSWKIQDFWTALARNDFRYIQILNDPILSRLYITLPTRDLLLADYSHGLDPQAITFWPWTFDFTVTTVALVNINQLIIGGERGNP